MSSKYISFMAALEFATKISSHKIFCYAKKLLFSYSPISIHNLICCVLLTKDEGRTKHIIHLFPVLQGSRELIFGATEYTTAIDIWFAGCVLAELMLGQE